MTKKYRVIQNGCGAEHPREKRQLTYGDVIEEIDITEYGVDVIRFTTYSGATHFFPLYDLEIIEIEESNKCTCDIFSLMVQGCKCGGI